MVQIHRILRKDEDSPWRFVVVYRRVSWWKTILIESTTKSPRHRGLVGTIVCSLGFPRFLRLFLFIWGKPWKNEDFEPTNWSLGFRWCSVSNRWFLGFVIFFWKPICRFTKPKNHLFTNPGNKSKNHFGCRSTEICKRLFPGKGSTFREKLLYLSTKKKTPGNSCGWRATDNMGVSRNSGTPKWLVSCRKWY